MFRQTFTANAARFLKRILPLCIVEALQSKLCANLTHFCYLATKLLLWFSWMFLLLKTKFMLINFFLWCRSLSHINSSIDLQKKSKTCFYVIASVYVSCCAIEWEWIWFLWIGVLKIFFKNLFENTLDLWLC